MKTPLDPAVRLGRRALDARRREIGDAARALATLEAMAAQLADQARREADALASHPALGGAAHLARLREQRGVLLGEIARADAALLALREVAGEEMARLSALESAAARHREAALAERERQAGAEADDRAATRFLLARSARA